MRTLRFPLQLAVAALAVTTVSASLSAQANLVINGGFETANFTGWTNTTGCQLFDGGSSSYAAGFNTSTCIGPISQTFSTSPGQAYSASFFARNTNPSTTGNTLTFGISEGPSIFNSFVDNSSFQKFTGSFTATGTSTTISIGGTFGANNAGTLLFDDVSVTAVSTTPEPTSIALLGTGLIALFPMIRRKKAS